MPQLTRILISISVLSISYNPQRLFQRSIEGPIHDANSRVSSSASAFAFITNSNTAPVLLSSTPTRGSQCQVGVSSSCPKPLCFSNTCKESIKTIPTRNRQSLLIVSSSSPPHSPQEDNDDGDEESPKRNRNLSTARRGGRVSSLDKQKRKSNNTIRHAITKRTSENYKSIMDSWIGKAFQFLLFISLLKGILSFLLSGLLSGGGTTSSGSTFYYQSTSTTVYESARTLNGSGDGGGGGGGGGGGTPNRYSFDSYSYSYSNSDGEEKRTERRIIRSDDGNGNRSEKSLDKEYGSGESFRGTTRSDVPIQFDE